MKVAKKRSARAAVLMLAALCAVLYGVMYANARTVKVEYSDVYLKHLPDAFEGTRLLYVSDLHIAGEGDSRRVGRLMTQLSEVRPDILLMGGDYTDLRVWNQLRCIGSEERKTRLLNRIFDISHFWMRTLSDFYAPMGKFAVRGNHDVFDETLREHMAAGGVQLLVNECAVIEKAGRRLIIAGLDDYVKGEPRITDVTRQISSEDCVILLSHNPDILPQVYTTDAADGGAWADLALCGHTHGGQVTLGSIAPITNSEFGKRFLTGWREEVSGYQLTSNGIGTSNLPIRFGAPAQAHVITLHCSRPVE